MSGRIAGARTFPMGGVHPQDRKYAAAAAIVDLAPTATVAIPVSQHIGRPGNVVVEKGSVVRVGTLLAEANGFISAPVHSSVSGTVKKLDTVVDATGVRRAAVLIAVDGDEWEPEIARNTQVRDEIAIDRAEIVPRIAAAGIVGAGGATFPTAVKFSIPEGKRVDTLIINGVECEPYLTADHRLMLELADQIIVGTRLLMRAAAVDRAIIAIETNKPDAIDHMIARVAAAGPLAEGTITVQPVAQKYPQGGEKQLIRALTGREVPSGRLPLDVQCVVSNVATANAVYDAIQCNRPFIDRIVTVTGRGLASPSNFRVRLGTPFTALAEAVGGVPAGTGKVIIGGPMTGKAAPSLDVPVTKGSGGLIFVEEAEARRPQTQPCIRCAMCVGVCPMGLEPYLLEQLARAGRWDRLEAEGVMDCIECGSCSFACPAARPLLDWLRLGKARVGAIRRERSAAKAGA